MTFGKNIFAIKVYFDLNNSVNLTIENKVFIKFEYYFYRKRHNIRTLSSLIFSNKNVKFIT